MRYYQDTFGRVYVDRGMGGGLEPVYYASPAQTAALGQVAPQPAPPGMFPWFMTGLAGIAIGWLFGKTSETNKAAAFMHGLGVTDRDIDLYKHGMGFHPGFGKGVAYVEKIKGGD